MSEATSRDWDRTQRVQAWPLVDHIWTLIEHWAPKNISNTTQSYYKISLHFSQRHFAIDFLVLKDEYCSWFRFKESSTCVSVLVCSKLYQHIMCCTLLKKLKIPSFWVFILPLKVYRGKYQLIYTLPQGIFPTHITGVCLVFSSLHCSITN